MINSLARQRYLEENKAKGFVDGIFKATSDAIELKKENQQLIAMIAKKDDIVSQAFNKLGSALVQIYNVIPRTIKFPAIQKVEVTKSEPIEIKNLKDLEKGFTSLEKQILMLRNKPYPSSFMVDNLDELSTYFISLEKKVTSLISAIQSIPAPKIEVPKIEIPKFETKTVEKPDNKALLSVTSSLNQLREAFDGLSDRLAEGMGKEIKFPKAISVDNFPVQLTPQPVTHISLNALQGVPKATTMTVGNAATPIPATNLTNRRDMIVYNNDASATLYLGGSAVTTGGTTQGLPIPAGSYSPSLSLGQNVNLYGISTTNISVTCLELSEEASGR